MKRIIFFIVIIGLIYSCAHKDKKSSQFEQNVIVGKNIDRDSYDEVTGWTRILLKVPAYWGYIDKDSNVVIPFIFEYLNPFDSEGMALGQIRNKQGFINTNCDTIIPFIYDELGLFNIDLARAELKNKTGFINRKGETVIPFQYDEAHEFIDCGVAQVSYDGKWGFINTLNEVVIPLIYSEVDYHHKDSLLFVSKNGKWAIFDHLGKQKTDFIYDEIYGTRNNFDYFNEKYLFNGILLTRRKSQYRYLNRNLDIVADFGYYFNAEPISEYGFALVKKGNYYGIIDSTGKTIIPFEYSLIKHPPKPYQGFYNEFYIKKGGKYGILNERAEPITDISYDSFERDYCKITDDSTQVVFITRKRDLYGIININGEIILPIKYDEVRPFEGNCNLPYL